MIATPNASSAVWSSQSGCSQESEEREITQNGACVAETTWSKRGQGLVSDTVDH